jgi:ABC-type branched-subunit amino acid transport system ATPase component
MSTEVPIMTTDPTTTFRLEGVTKRFGALTAVNDVNLELGDVGVTALVGPNGAGKTTLFNLITGQLKPTEGRIHLNGADVTRHAAQDMARLGIGRSFQDIRLFEGMSARDNVMVYAQDVMTGRMTSTFIRPLGMRRAKREARARADEVLEYLGITALCELPAETLSFAQQKVVAIARLLALQPRILFLDEPASGLDDRGRKMLADVIRKLAEDRVAVCFVEHNTHLVRELATRVIFVSQGTVMADGDPEEVFSNTKLAEVFLGLG